MAYQQNLNISFIVNKLNISRFFSPDSDDFSASAYWSRLDKFCAVWCNFCFDIAFLCIGCKQIFDGTFQLFWDTSLGSKLAVMTVRREQIASTWEKKVEHEQSFISKLNNCIIAPRKRDARSDVAHQQGENKSNVFSTICLRFELNIGDRWCFSLGGGCSVRMEEANRLMSMSGSVEGRCRVPEVRRGLSWFARD